MPAGSRNRFHVPPGKNLFCAWRSRHSQMQSRLAWADREKKRMLKQHGLIGDALPSQWLWTFEEQRGEVSAFTKGEARAQIKKILAISKNRPLPQTVVIQKVVLNEFTT